MQNHASSCRVCAHVTVQRTILKDGWEGSVSSFRGLEATGMRINFGIWPRDGSACLPFISSLYWTLYQYKRVCCELAPRMSRVGAHGIREFPILVPSLESILTTAHWSFTQYERGRPCPLCFLQNLWANLPWQSPKSSFSLRSWPHQVGFCETRMDDGCWHVGEAKSRPTEVVETAVAVGDEIDNNGGQGIFLEGSCVEGSG